MQQKYLALALSAIFATTALTGCGSDNDKNYQPEQPKPEQPKPEQPKPEEPKPENPGTDNPVDNPGDAAEGTSDLNKDETVGGQQYVRGENSNFDKLNNQSPNNANSTVLNTVTLQNKKLNNIVLGRETITVLDDQGNPVIKEIIRYAGNPNGANSLDTTNGAYGDDQNLQAKNTTALTSSTKPADIVNDINNFNTGLIYNTNDKSDNAVTLGSEEYAADTNSGDTGVRIFGNNYDSLDNTGDNSYRFTGKVDTTKLNNTKNDLVDPNTVASLEKMKLRNVQYGRVTSNIDPLKNLTPDQAKADYVGSKIVAKSNKDAVDTYFYRGTNETTIAQMNALQEKGGKFNYSGHALMYGIDNTYHGDNGKPNSNSFGKTETAIAGVGNFVNATVDMGKREVEGNVFNVWEINSPTDKDDDAKVYRKDNVVDFSGSIYGNTVKGNANLSYDKTNKGAFKGSFYGKNAEELGGSFNSVTSGYGQSSWGGVFGAQKDVVNGNENQTENAKP